MKKTAYSVAIIGATGLVGGAVKSILAERRFPIKKLYLLASKRSVDEEIEDVEAFDFHQSQISFFCTGVEVSAKYIPRAVKCDNIVIDKSSHFRYEEDIPLIVPEVNEEVIKQYKNRNIIANPNCTTIPITVALKPIYDAVGISRINIATYQSVSGAGKNGVKELSDQTIRVLNGQDAKAKTFPQQIAFNVIPHIDDFEKNGYTREEMKLVWEIQKILGDEKIGINPTTARVPVFYGHAAALHIETKKKITVEKAKKLLSEAPGIKLIEGKYPYPTPVKEASGKDWVYVGRLREDISSPKGLNLWVVADNLRKGAALNAVQIAEKLVQSYL